MQTDVISVRTDTLVGEVAKTKVEGFRFVTISCIELDGDTFDLLYHFDKELVLKHLGLNCSRDSIVPSISAVYLAAFLVENEIQDLFGIRFNGLAINFERTLYLEEEVTVTPFCKYSVETSDKTKCFTQPNAAGSN